MQHITFEGTHFEIGFHWGSLLAKRGIFILERIPFPLTEERAAFAEHCLPAYQAYFPQILEEIQGIALGQGCSALSLQAALFSMYALPPACHCSCFAVSYEEHILFGRNSDFLTGLEGDCSNMLYRFPRESNSYSFMGDTTSFIQMEDGVNKAGLAVGLASIYPPSIQPGMNAGMLLRFFLEKCATVQEALEWSARLPIASAQTFTIADRTGKIAQLECFAEGIEARFPTEERPFVCGANLFHAPSLREKNVPAIDTWQAQRRYETMECFLSRSAREMDLAAAQGLLAGEHGFLCQYDPSTGRDTLWSVAADLEQGLLFRAEGNPSRCAFTRDGHFCW